MQKTVDLLKNKFSLNKRNMKKHQNRTEEELKDSLPNSNSEAADSFNEQESDEKMTENPTTVADNITLEEDEELNKQKQELQDMKDKYLRLVAEFDNFRKRTAKEKQELISAGGERVLSQLLEVLDDADRAEAELDKESVDMETQIEGVKLVFNKLRKNVTNNGVAAFSKKGEDFSADWHEAIAEVPVSDENMRGKIVDVVLKGYTLNDKIIRYAKVVVGK